MCTETFQGAPVRGVLSDSPAYDAGFSAGCRILSVGGNPVRDVVDWQWLSSDDHISLEYIDGDGDHGFVDLVRDTGEPWGFDFDGVIFDGVHECRNACTFCFMRMLPNDVRPSLVLRDDDFRMSFLSGTFVTFTNITDEDEQRILEQHISPLRFSLHAIEPEVRLPLIGKHHEHGIDVAERLLNKGIHLHAQIVLLPGVNDAEHLDATLEWAYSHPNVDDVGVVPLGYTRFQDTFSKSFDDVESATAVVRQIEAWQSKAREQRGIPWVHAADEFYINAFPDSLFDNLPAAENYGSFSMFEDGIGIVRSFIDDWRSSSDEEQNLADALHETGKNVVFVAGCAQTTFFGPLIAQGPLEDCFTPLYVENEYFGGNVDVTGLLCGCDIAKTVADDSLCQSKDTLVVIPHVVLNDDGLFLDNMDMEGLQHAAGREVSVVSCNASDFFPQLTDLAFGKRKDV